MPLAELNDPYRWQRVCLAQAVSLLGQAEKSYAFLHEALADALLAQKQWGLGVLAEMAARPVLELLAKAGMQHLRLQALAEQIKAM